MKFNSKSEKLEWLKKAATKIGELEIKKNRAIMQGNFTEAFLLLKGIKEGQRQFKKVSLTLRKGVK